MTEKPKLLVIDDELSASLKMYIKSLGYDVDVADSAIGGLGLCKDPKCKYDIIIQGMEKNIFSLRPKHHLSASGSITFLKTNTEYNGMLLLLL